MNINGNTLTVMIHFAPDCMSSCAVDPLPGYSSNTASFLLRRQEAPHRLYFYHFVERATYYALIYRQLCWPAGRSERRGPRDPGSRPQDTA
jgi:hypothetical protein